VIALSAVLLAGCTPARPTGLLPPSVQGPRGHEFAISLPTPPKTRTTGPDPTVIVVTKHGPDIRSVWSLENHGVVVSVYELNTSIARSRAAPLLRSFLWTKVRGSVSSWRGHPSETVHFSYSASPSKPTYNDGEFVIWDHRTVFTVIVAGRSDSFIQSVFDSFRIT